MSKESRQSRLPLALLGLTAGVICWLCSCTAGRRAAWAGAAARLQLPACHLPEHVTDTCSGKSSPLVHHLFCWPRAPDHTFTPHPTPPHHHHPLPPVAPSSLAAWAGHTALNTQFPFRWNALDLALQPFLVGLTPSEARAAQATGRAAGLSIVATILGDRFDNYVPFSPAPPGSKAGLYQYAPGQTFVVYPQIQQTRPLVVKNIAKVWAAGLISSAMGSRSHLLSAGSCGLARLAGAHQPPRRPPPSRSSSPGRR